MRTLLLCGVLVGLAGGALAAQTPPRRIAPNGAPGATATATVQVRLEILPFNGLTFARTESPNSAGAQFADARINVQTGQPGELTIEIWKRSGEQAAERRRRVVATLVRVQQDTTGQVRGNLPASVAAALEEAAERPGVYTVVIAY